MDTYGLARCLSERVVININVLTYRRASVLFVVFTLTFHVACTKPDHKKGKVSEKETVGQLKSEDWHVREKGVFSLKDIEDEGRQISADAQRRLRALIKEEITQFKNFKGRLESEYKSPSRVNAELYKKYPPGRYDDYASVLARLVAMRKDRKDISEVFQLVADTNFTISPAILAIYGVEGLDYFVEKTKGSTAREKQLAINVLSILARSSTEADDFESSEVPILGDTDRKKIKSVLLKAVEDSDYNVRFAAINGLKNFIADPNVKSVLLNIADADREQFIRQTARETLRHGQ